MSSEVPLPVTHSQASARPCKSPPCRDVPGQRCWTPRMPWAPGELWTGGHAGLCNALHQGVRRTTQRWGCSALSSQLSAAFVHLQGSAPPTSSVPELCCCSRRRRGEAEQPWGGRGDAPSHAQTRGGRCRSTGSRPAVPGPRQRCVGRAGMCVNGVRAAASQTFTCCSAMHSAGCRNADTEEVGRRGEEEMQ